MVFFTCNETPKTKGNTMYILAVCNDNNWSTFKFDNIEDAKSFLVEDYLHECACCGVEDPFDEDNSRHSIMFDHTEAHIDWYDGRVNWKIIEV